MSSRNKFDRLSEHIDSLHAGFWMIAKSSSLANIVKTFADVFFAILPHSVVHCAHRAKGGTEWKVLAGEGSRVVDECEALRLQDAGGAYQHHVTGNRLVALQMLGDGSIMGVLVERKRKTERWSDTEKLSVRLACTLLENAYADLLHRRTEKDLLFSMNHRILQLNSLVATGIELATLDEHASPHRLALIRAASLTNASAARVTIKRGKDLKEEYTFPEGAQRPGLKADRLKSSFTYAGDTYTFELFTKESRSGTLPFDDTDKTLLDALAQQVNAALENRFLHLQALEKQRIEQEISVAASIQQRIIPVSLPSLAGYAIAGKNIPTKSVGGDYYDCIPLPEGKYALIVADVTGKGVPAALLVSSLHAFLSVYLQVPATLPELLGKLNKALCNATTEDKFVTAFLVILSPETGEIEYSSAGHNPGFLHRVDGTVEAINVGGPPLGAFDFDIVFKSERKTIGRGDSLFLYTDGVSEATNPKDEMYEQKFPLSTFVKNNANSQPELFIADLVADIRKFAGSAPQSDDITLLYLSRSWSAVPGTSNPLGHTKNTI